MNPPDVIFIHGDYGGMFRAMAGLFLALPIGWIFLCSYFRDIKPELVRPAGYAIVGGCLIAWGILGGMSLMREALERPFGNRYALGFLLLAAGIVCRIAGQLVPSRMSHRAGRLLGWLGVILVLYYGYRLFG
jgi:hypothetical protein